MAQSESHHGDARHADDHADYGKDSPNRPDVRIEKRQRDGLQGRAHGQQGEWELANRIARRQILPAVLGALPIATNSGLRVCSPFLLT